MANISIKCPECGGDKARQVGPNQYCCEYCSHTFIVNNPTTAATAAPALEMIYCPYCHAQVSVHAAKCNHCGEWIKAAPAPAPAQAASTSSKSKVAAAILAFLVGPLGVDKFYLGKTGAGVAMLLVTLLLSWTVVVPIIVYIICVVNGIVYLCSSDAEWNAKYPG